MEKQSRKRTFVLVGELVLVFASKTVVDGLDDIIKGNGYKKLQSR